MPVAPAFPEAGPGRAHGAPLRTGIPAGNAAGCQPGVMQPESEDPDAGRRASASGRTHLLVSLGSGILGGTAAALLGAGRAAPLIGWDILALVFCRWVWSAGWGVGGGAPARPAEREEPGRAL